MKKVLLVLVMFLSLAALGQSEPSNYATAIARFRQYYNHNQPDSIFNMFSPEVQQVITLDKSRQMVTQLQSQLGDLNTTSFIDMNNEVASYKATFARAILMMKVRINARNKMAGLLFDNYVDPSAPAKPTDATAANTTAMNPEESEYVYKTNAGNIYGTLTVPQNTQGKVPVVLMIAGSGPTDRDDNTLQLGIKTDDFKQLAAALLKSNIASLRYDKRMVGKSIVTTKESQLRIDNYYDDAVGLINQLHNDPRFSKVIVLGHSEGSLVGILACEDQPADAFISVAGAGRIAYEILTEQMKSQPDYVAQGFKKVMDSLRVGKLQPNVDASLYGIARPSIQPYLMSWMSYDPAKELKKLKIPVLIIQGTTDLQVKVLDAEKLKKAKSDATLVIIPNMNHVLKDAPEDRDKNLATYNDPKLPLKPEFVTAVIDFINKVK